MILGVIKILSDGFKEENILLFFVTSVPLKMGRY